TCPLRHLLWAMGRPGEVDLEGGVEGGQMTLGLDQGGGERRLESLPVADVDHLERPHGIDRLDHRHRHARRPQLTDEAGDERSDRCRRRGSHARVSSAVALSMSDWYLSKTWSVSVTASVSRCSMARARRVRAQSIDSETEGAFFRSICRIERTIPAI